MKNVFLIAVLISVLSSSVQAFAWWNESDDLTSMQNIAGDYVVDQNFISPSVSAFGECADKKENMYSLSLDLKKRTLTETSVSSEAMQNYSIPYKLSLKWTRDKVTLIPTYIRYVRIKQTIVRQTSHLLPFIASTELIFEFDESGAFVKYPLNGSANPICKFIRK